MERFLQVLKWVVLGSVIVLVFQQGYSCGARKGRDQVSKLTALLAESTETIELTTGLYAATVAQVEDLTALLNTNDAKIAEMQRVIDQLNAEVLVLEKISVRWKKAYEDALDARQTEEPPVEPGGDPRKRVDFEGNLGPIRATGHTLTDPPEAFLKLEQVVPLTLTMTVVQNPDGTWTTLVTPSDDNIEVKVDLAAVDPLVLSQKWYQRLWVELSTGILGDPAGSLSLGYYGDRLSLGAGCSLWEGGRSCGLNVGFRVFK